MSLSSGSSADLLLIVDWVMVAAEMMAKYFR